MSPAGRSFEQRVAMITGAAGHLGRAVAHGFASRGATLLLLDRRPDRLARIYGPENDAQIFACADLVDPDATARAVDTAFARCQRIDVLCNIAGAFRMGPPVHETSDEDFDFLLDVNARSLLHAVRAVVPRMIRGGGGKIVNVAANAAQKGVAHMGAYCAAKSVVIRLTETLSAELREQAINVNCVLPTIIDTPDNRAAMPQSDPGRWVAPEDLANVIVFLASEEARAIHGAAIPVSGLT